MTASKSVTFMTKKASPLASRPGVAIDHKEELLTLISDT